MKSLALPLLMIVTVLTSPALAGDQCATIQINIVNSSLHPKYLEIKDEICSSAVSQECELAEFILKSPECQKDRKAEKCREADETMNGASCVEGMVYYGLLERDEAVSLEICANQAGKGKVAIRSSQSAPWVHYNWVDAGDTITPH